MAEIGETHEQQTPMKGSKEVVGEEKWANHYSSSHQMLLVGEGDFSFSLSLATSFGSASNVVASSLDTYDNLIKKYKNAKTNLDTLGNFGAQLLHGVDAVKMKNHSDLRMQKFDRIVFNFPNSAFPDKETDHFTIVIETELKKLLAHMSPLALARLAPGLISVTESLIPDRFSMPKDLQPSSSGVASSQPPKSRDRAWIFCCFLGVICGCIPFLNG